ncbi:hypothetical protein [Wenxinia marina]|uniref:Uncharacterized protein n=1 Tax=Wenxinia marina DSM 24838 TaxID=1123501 RepID=A0A0D0Q6D0_9RHOB|nr:hypothetical protein [Wenxinia marina]KIQ68017.1 hypothetical protein Wenmar_03473 [Wenxinia marina DSM 24838]GGL75359.1 hypothetical protein GCM10011392_32530 [Wenxinia marina]
MFTFHAIDHRASHEAFLPWEEKRTTRRTQPQTLRFTPPAPGGVVVIPHVPPPEPIIRAGGRSGWLVRLFRRPARALAAS